MTSGAIVNNKDKINNKNKTQQGANHMQNIRNQRRMPKIDHKDDFRPLL